MEQHLDCIQNAVSGLLHRDLFSPMDLLSDINVNAHLFKRSFLKRARIYLCITVLVFCLFTTDVRNITINHLVIS